MDWNSMGFSCYIEQLFFVCLYVLYHGFIETKNIQKASKKIKSIKKRRYKSITPSFKRPKKGNFSNQKKLFRIKKTSGTTFKIKKQEKTILRNVSKD